MRKKEILDKILNDLAETKASLVRGYEKNKKDSIEAPSAMESHSDTSRSQFGKLAENFIKQIEDTDNAIKAIREINYKESNTIKEGSLVQIEEENKLCYVFLVPKGAGGQNLESKENHVQILSSNSKVGLELLSKKIGDVVKFVVPAGTRQLKILSIK